MTTLLLPPTAAPVRPFEDTRARLRALAAGAPRVYAVACIDEEPRRRWWFLGGPERQQRIDLLYARALADVEEPRIAAEQVAAALIHAVVGRVLAPYALEGRVWDPGLDNLWLHMDSDGCIDWAGVADDTLRVLPEDRAVGHRDVVVLPCERAMAVWTAHRSVTALTAVYAAVRTNGPLDAGRFWGIVGRTVVTGAAQLPVLGGASRRTAARRGQELLDAFVAAGYPVRGLARLGQPSL
ncbi:hypothetical protein OED52_11090 [Rhodococcus sp. Z13]|uniref:Uncharacterized protein n=1 Tax=Rhodococcus sacchari TaxID=2962047 RepID=A0ACD4DBB4_9NOCA|nr:hypothetical protein [Rhodococcus sp. Z13]UYP17276.1 hypothetical protein OED52_11090 [Rhodococcus sp. Z13]